MVGVNKTTLQEWVIEYACLSGLSGGKVTYEYTSTALRSPTAGIHSLADCAVAVDNNINWVLKSSADTSPTPPSCQIRQGKPGGSVQLAQPPSSAKLTAANKYRHSGMQKECAF